MKDVAELFFDKKSVLEIQTKLPKLFRIAEIETSRAGRIGMEVGSLREKIIIALFIYKFGEEKVNAEIPITEPEVDVFVNNRPYSIKTITGNGGIKAVWTVDAESSANFIKMYEPKCAIFLTQIFWGQEKDSVWLIPLKVQQDVFNKLGRNKYLNLPKVGTNPRGIEFSREAISMMLNDKESLKITISWKRDDMNYDVYEKWVDQWKNI